MTTRSEALRRIRTTLVKRRDALRKLLASSELELRTPTEHVGDTIDAALDAEHLELQSQLTTAETRELDRIENAIQQISNKRFGKCEACDKEIPLARLEALPYATQCIDCQRAGEATNGRLLRQGGGRFSEPMVNHDLPSMNYGEMTSY